MLETKKEHVLNHQKVLVVEDDETLEIVMDRIFQSIDSSITYKWVITAEKAIAELQTAHYDLVVADFSLQGKGTGLDLWEFCQERFPEKPFVMISSLGIDQFFKLVGDYRISPLFLPKPFYTGECRQVVGHLLEQA